MECRSDTEKPFDAADASITVLTVRRYRRVRVHDPARHLHVCEQDARKDRRRRDASDDALRYELDVVCAFCVGPRRMILSQLRLTTGQLLGPDPLPRHRCSSGESQVHGRSAVASLQTSGVCL
jgi:hypothetical protein